MNNGINIQVLLQFFAAGGRKIHTLFKKGERLFQGYVPLFQFLNDFFQALEALFKLGQ